MAVFKSNNYSSNINQTLTLLNLDQTRFLFIFHYGFYDTVKYATLLNRG